MGRCGQVCGVCGGIGVRGVLGEGGAEEVLAVEGPGRSGARDGSRQGVRGDRGARRGGRGQGVGAGGVEEAHVGVGAKGFAAGEGIRGPRRRWAEMDSRARGGALGAGRRPVDAGPAQGVRSSRESIRALQSRARSPGAT